MKTILRPANSQSLLLGKLGAATAVAAAVALGVLHLVDSSDKEEELDTTAYLLRNEANRRRLLAAVERDKNRQLVARELL